MYVDFDIYFYVHVDDIYVYVDEAMGARGCLGFGIIVSSKGWSPGPPNLWIRGTEILRSPDPGILEPWIP